MYTTYSSVLISVSLWFHGQYTPLVRIAARPRASVCRPAGRLLKQTDRVHTQDEEVETGSQEEQQHSIQVGGLLETEGRRTEGRRPRSRASSSDARTGSLSLSLFPLFTIRSGESEWPPRRKKEPGTEKERERESHRTTGREVAFGITFLFAYVHVRM